MSQPPHVDHLSTLEAEGVLLVDIVRRVDADAAIPTCPGWTIRDLALHVGEVHRWASAVVEQGATTPAVGDVVGQVPADRDLADWLHDGHQRLVEVLRSADPELAALTFLADPPKPVQFWKRRQAHETAMHRVDAQSATGRITAFGPAFAADGVDEMLTGFVPRSRTPLHTDTPRTMGVTLDDAEGSWLLTISDGTPTTERGTSGGDCTVSGTASDVLQALWNRQGTERLTIDGDASVFDLFRDNVHVRWS